MFPNLYLIKSVIILDRDGRRLFSKYYPSAYGAAVATAPDDSNATRALFPDTHAKQDAFERLVYDKTKGCLLGQAILLEDQLVVYKASADIIFYVAAVLDANELLINAVLEALHDTCLSVLARALPVSATSTVLPSLSDVDKKLLMDNYDVLAVIVDELIDNGYHRPFFCVLLRPSS